MRLYHVAHAFERDRPFPQVLLSTCAAEFPGVTASTRDDRERLLRYCARPPLSLERLSLTKDGQVAYALKRSIRGATHRLLTPLASLARLCALIPPPRHPLIRFHAVLAPHSALRKKVVPTPTDTRRAMEAPRAPEPPFPAQPNPESAWKAARLDWATLLRRNFRQPMGQVWGVRSGRQVLTMMRPTAGPRVAM